MRLKTIKGRLVWKNCNRFKIDWNQKSKSGYQKQVKDFLYPYWKNHIVFEEFPVFGSRLKLDFYNATMRIAIEMQGEFHEKFSKFAHKSRLGYLKQVKRDMKKVEWCEMNNIVLVEVFPQDLPLTYNFFVENYDIHI